MTRYHKLMDAIKDILYDYYTNGQDNKPWDEQVAGNSAKEILHIVEEYQSIPMAKAWRASD